MSDDEHESDGLDALASGLQANEGDEADDELDLASLAAVVGARAPEKTTSAGDAAPAEAAAEKLVLTPAAAAPSLPAPVVAASAVAPAAPVNPAVAAPAPVAHGRAWLVPTLVAFAIGVGVMGYVLGRSSRPGEVEAAAPSAPPAEPVSAPPMVAAPPPPPAAPIAAAPAQPTVVAATPTASPQPPSAPKPVRPAGTAAAPAPAPVAREQGEPSEVAAAPSESEADKPAEGPAALAKAEPATNRSVDDLLDDALSGNARAALPQPAVLPEAPSRDEVTQAMAVLLPAIRGCAMGQTGLATAGIVVRGDGRVASVELSGAPFEGTASGRCMEGVLRRARFARFRQPTFRVRFPFAIQ